MVTGEARVDRRGLLIDDRAQGWSLRVGEISQELLYDAAAGDRFFYEDLKRQGAVWGVRWGVEF